MLEHGVIIYVLYTSEILETSPWQTCEQFEVKLDESIYAIGPLFLYLRDGPDGPFLLFDSWEKFL